MGWIQIGNVQGPEGPPGPSGNGVNSAKDGTVELVPGVGGPATAIILRTDTGKRVRVWVTDDLTVHVTDLTGSEGPATPALSGPVLNTFLGPHLIWSWLTNQDELYTVQLYVNDVATGEPFGPWSIADVSSTILGHTLFVGETYKVTVTAQRNNLTASTTSDEYTYGG